MRNMCGAHGIPEVSSVLILQIHAAVLNDILECLNDVRIHTSDRVDILETGKFEAHRQSSEYFKFGAARCQRPGGLGKRQQSLMVKNI